MPGCGQLATAALLVPILHKVLGHAHGPRYDWTCQQEEGIIQPCNGLFESEKDFLKPQDHVAYR